MFIEVDFIKERYQISDEDFVVERVIGWFIVEVIRDRVDVNVIDLVYLIVDLVNSTEVVKNIWKREIFDND